MTWGRPQHRSSWRARPSWWPEGEPWPPAGPALPQSSRARFLRRLRALFFALFFFFIVGSAAAFWLGGGHRPFVAPATLLVLFLIFLMFGRWARGVARPVGDLIEAAGQVAEGDYSTRVPERGPPEVRALARTFNQMIVRLQSSDERRRKLLADVTHDLRTPLTVIQGNLEGLLDGIYPRDDAHLLPVLEETRLLSRLVDDLRTLTLAEAGELQLRKEAVDLGLLVEETVASFHAEADAAGVTLAARTSPQPSTILADPSRIRQVLENLLVNALRYTPRGGTIQVECAPSAAGGTVAVAVRDTGQGIPPGELPHVFDRFYKSSDSKGSGLGLTIARNLVAAHDGEIAAESELGRGTTITVTLPAGAS